MYIKGKYSWLKHMDFMFIDILVLICSFVISYYLKFDAVNWWDHDTWQLLLVSLCLLNIVITFLDSRFSGVIRRLLYEDVIVSVMHTLYMVASTSLAFYVFKVGSFFSREMLLVMYTIYFILGIITSFFWKEILKKSKAFKKRSLYIVSNDKISEEVLADFSLDPTIGYKVVGLSNSMDFLDDLLKSGAQDVLFESSTMNISKDTYETLIANGIGIHINIESIIGFQTEEQYVTNVGAYKTLAFGVYSFTPRQMIYIWLKRFFDILCGLIGLIVLIPLSIIVKIAYLSKGDKKSIFYTQERVGKNGEIIKIYKFRSMVANADEVLKELLKDEKYRKEWEETQKFENDPRITKVGNFLRKTSLDEIPQLINVLKGDMSLVGPRPLVVGELEAHDGLKLYNSVKPGITGWWGCNGRSNLDYRTRLELEYYYVKNCSLYLDGICILKTILAVLKRDGSK